MNPTILFLAVVLLVSLALGTLWLRYLVFQRLSRRLDAAWGELLDQYALTAIPCVGLQKTTSRRWSGKVGGHDAQLLAHKIFPSKFIEDWQSHAILQVRLDPGPVRMITDRRGAYYWSLSDNTYLRTRLRSMMPWIPTALEAVDGIEALRATGHAEPLPRPIHDTLLRVVERGNLWISNESLVLVWRLDTELERTLRESFDDATMLAEWLG